MQLRHADILDNLTVETLWNLSEQERAEKAAKAAREKAEKAASREEGRAEKAAKTAAAAERRILSQGPFDISKEVVPRIADTEDEDEGRPAQRAGARRLGSIPPSSNGSVRCDLPHHACISWKASMRSRTWHACQVVMVPTTIHHHCVQTGPDLGVSWLGNA